MSHPPFLISPALATRHGFFTRRGGVSTGGYASLNGSLSGGDDRDAVLENRARIAASLDLAPETLLGLKQVHGIDVIRVTQPWPVGTGAAADAMVTYQPGIGLGIITADCAPVLFADPEAGVIGAAHAGWRSAVAGVLEATIAAMAELGARRIVAVIGPCIAQASYEVGPDLRDAALAQDAGAKNCFAPGATDRWQFDLAGYCAGRLERAGATVANLGRDTYAEEADFFSHRRRTHAGGGAIGHQLSVIRL